MGCFCFCQITNSFLIIFVKLYLDGNGGSVNNAEKQHFRMIVFVKEKLYLTKKITLNNLEMSWISKGGWISKPILHLILSLKQKKSCLSLLKGAKCPHLQVLLVCRMNRVHPLIPNCLLFLFSVLFLASPVGR